MADRVASDAESSRRDRTKSAATRKRSEADTEQNKRPGFFAGIWLFFKQVIDEMKKVTYPTGSETWTYFLVVVAARPRCGEFLRRCLVGFFRKYFENG